MSSSGLPPLGGSVRFCHGIEGDEEEKVSLQCSTEVMLADKSGVLLHKDEDGDAATFLIDLPGQHVIYRTKSDQGKPGIFSKVHSQVKLFSTPVAMGLLLYLSVLQLSAVMSIPLWLSGALTDDSFTAPTINYSPSDNEQFISLHNLTMDWQRTPIQGNFARTCSGNQHTHRFGMFYQVLVYLHVIFGVLLEVTVLWILAGRPTSLLVKRMWVGKSLWSSTAAEVRAMQLEKIVLKRRLVILWVAHLSVALPMAFTRMFNHGRDPCNWKQSFSLGFFG
jgi:hypothetical protein